MSALAHADTALGPVVLDMVAKKLVIKEQIDVSARIVDGTYERTIDGASTLTLMVDDGDRELLRSGIFGVPQFGLTADQFAHDSPLDVEIDNLWYRLVQVQKQQNTLTLTFEDRIVSMLRNHTKPRKASRAKMTRAEFVLSLVREVKEAGPIPFICPELHVLQNVAPITNSGQAVTAAQRKGGVAHGIAPGAQLTVRGVKATPEQIANGEKVLDVANSYAASPLATLALIEACIDESSMRNLSYGDSTSTGILQVLSSTAKGIGINPRDVSACAQTFLTRGFYHGGAITNAAKYPTKSAGWIAQQSQGSADPSGSNYDAFQAEAQKWIAAYTGPTPGSKNKQASKKQLKLAPFYFQRGGTAGKPEDSWSCMQRLAHDVDWRCFCADGAIYFVDDETLLGQKPDAMVYEGTKGVENIDFQIDNGKVKSDVTLTARTALHGFPPGACVDVYDCGPADGRWLVSDHVRGIFDPLATITLTRAVRPLLESAPKVLPPTTPQPPAGPGGSSAPPGGPAGEKLDPKVGLAYAAALAISKKNYPYILGGGHEWAGFPDRANHDFGPVGYDCSGSVGAALARAGMGFKLKEAVPASSGFEKWGVAGSGRTMSLYANADHVYLVFHTSKGVQTFTTANYGKRLYGSGNGPCLETGAVINPAPYVVRHWPGT